MRHRKSRQVLAIALVVVGCVAPEQSTPRASPPDAVDSDRVTGMVNCGGPAFPISVLTEDDVAEQGSGPAAEALRQLLARPEGSDILPSTGWRLAVDTGDTIVYVADVPAGGDTPPFANVTLEFVNGIWQVIGFGQCRPVPDVGPGLGLAEFRIAPGQALDPSSTEVEVLVTERSCNSGEDARGRIVRPSVKASAGAVTVVFGVRSRAGNHTCQSNPETPFTLELPEALGDRPLLDGSSIPPRDARECTDSAPCP
jgi:hypothetical protein